MEKAEIKDYFNHLAPSWDSMDRADEGIVAEILDNARIGKGLSVLDVACGTGVMFPRYIEREVLSVDGIDISAEMIKLAKSKFPRENIRLTVADAELYEPGILFDRIMVYNAFPHFPDPIRLIGRLSALLKRGGVLSVAHSMSREKLNEHHSGSAERVSRALLPAKELAEIFSRTLNVYECIDDERMYQVCGMKP